MRRHAARSAGCGRPGRACVWGHSQPQEAREGRKSPRPRLAWTAVGVGQGERGRMGSDLCRRQEGTEESGGEDGTG